MFDLGLIVAVVYLVLALVYWVQGYRLQRSRTELERRRQEHPYWDEFLASDPSQLVQVPRFVSWLCGHPAAVGNLWVPASLHQLQGGLLLISALVFSMVGAFDTHPLHTLWWLMVVAMIEPMGRLQLRFG